MTNLKKIILTMLIVILIGATAVFATDTIIITDQNSTITSGNTTNTANTSNTTTLNTSNTSTYNNTSSNLPQTGADDYAIITIIAILAVVAVYAYKKVSDYKNI